MSARVADDRLSAPAHIPRKTHQTTTIEHRVNKMKHVGVDAVYLEAFILNKAAHTAEVLRASTLG
jgi:hypothetical protein